jgi:hypothetical protein
VGLVGRVGQVGGQAGLTGLVGLYLPASTSCPWLKGSYDRSRE